LIALATAANVPTVLDTSGPALRAGLLAGPSVAKPNADELHAILPAAGPDVSGPGTAAPNGRRPGPQGLADAVRTLATGPVVVSRGSAGLFAVAGDEVWECAPPVSVQGNPTGAGDACVAALARGLRDRTPWPALLPDAVALSAAAVAAPVAGAFDPDVYRSTRAIVTPASPTAPAAPPPGGNRARTHR